MLEHMMKNIKLTTIRLPSQKDSNDKLNKVTLSSDIKRFDQKPKEFSPGKGSKTYYSNGISSTKNAAPIRNFSTRNSKPRQDTDLLNQRRSLSKNNSKVKNYVQESTIQKKEKLRNIEILSSSNSKKEIYKKINNHDKQLYTEESTRLEFVKRESSASQNNGNSTKNTNNDENSKSFDGFNNLVNNHPTSTKHSSTNSIDMISISTLLSQHNNIPISLSNLKQNIEQYEPSKHSIKPLQNIRAYSANTHQGIIRNYNEDRVSIILNILKPSSFKGNYWPKCSFFGIYDGHGGSVCADFLRDNLHHYIIKDCHFPLDPVEAIKKGFDNCEREFINKVATNGVGEVIERSGSCALICLIINDIIYFANVGDSRAIMSCNGGETVVPITIDHKPNEENESKRIVNYGGRIYQTQTLTKNLNIPHLNISNNSNQILTGPYRVFPGRLSVNFFIKKVSRTFGDVEAKLPKLGGIENVIIAHPDIFTFKISQNMDYVLMGCRIFFNIGDGIFDQLTDKEVNECVWMTLNNTVKAKNIHSQIGLAVDMVIKNSLCRRTLDNVTCVIICFENFEKIYNNNKPFGEKTPKLNTLNYNSTESTNIDTKTPKLQKTETSESKDSQSTQKEKEALHSPKYMPVSAKNQNKKIPSLLENKQENSLAKDRKVPSFENITTSFFKNETNNSKIYKKISSNIDPVKLKINSANYFNKLNKKDYLSGFSTTKSNSKVSSIDKRIKGLQKDSSLIKKTNNSNISNANNKSIDKFSLKRINRLDFSENFTDSKFHDIKKKFGLHSNDNHNSSSKVKNKIY